MSKADTDLEQFQQLLEERLGKGIFVEWLEASAAAAVRRAVMVGDEYREQRVVISYMTIRDALQGDVDRAVHLLIREQAEAEWKLRPAPLEGMAVGEYRRYLYELLRCVYTDQEIEESPIAYSQMVERVKGLCAAAARGRE